MNRIKYLLMGLLLILLGCSEDVLQTDKPIEQESVTKIRISATVEENESSTRLAMAQDGLDMKFTWEEGDMIKLIFFDGANYAQSTTSVSSVSDDGKRAQFDVEIPPSIVSETFDLYGIFGSASFSSTQGEDSFVNLPAAPWAAALPFLQDEQLVMLRFEASGINIANPVISVTFRHVGSLFKIFLENNSTTPLNGVSSVDIFTDTPGAVLYAHQNNGVNTVKYDVVNGVFINGTTIFTNQLHFLAAAESDNILPSDILELWG